MTPFIAALALLAAPTDGMIVVGVEDRFGGFQTYVGGRQGVSTQLRRMPGQLWRPVAESGWEESGLVGRQGEEEIFTAQDGQVAARMKVPHDRSNQGFKVSFLALREGMASFHIYDPNLDPRDASRYDRLSFVWPAPEYKRVDYEAGLADQQKEDIQRDLAQQIEKLESSRRISPDHFNILNGWAWAHHQGRWKFAFQVSGAQRSASSVVDLMTDAYLPETDRKTADQLWSSVLGNRSEAVDVYASDEAKLAIIVTDTNIYLHDYASGRIGRELKSTMGSAKRIVVTEFRKGDEVAKYMQGAARSKATKPGS